MNTTTELYVTESDTTDNTSAKQGLQTRYNRLKSRVELFSEVSNFIKSSKLVVGDYKPMSGIQTASILGSILLLATAYLIYKGKCRPSQWTDKDRLFVEVYKQKLTEIQNRRKDAKHRQETDKEVRTELTALWIHTQPLVDCEEHLYESILHVEEEYSEPSTNTTETTCGTTIVTEATIETQC